MNMTIVKQKEKILVPKKTQDEKAVLKKRGVNPWLKIHGILKNKKITNPVRWQIKIRKESDERINRLVKTLKKKK